MKGYKRRLIVKRATQSDPSHLLIIEGHERVGELNTSDGFFELTEKNGQKFRITQKVDGMIHPFSAVVIRNRNEILRMKDAYFVFEGKLYSFWNHPEGESLASRHGPRRFITRLDTYDNVEPWNQSLAEQRDIKRSRGTKVGELSGYSTSGHSVLLTDEKLDSIAIPLAAISSLFFSGV